LEKLGRNEKETHSFCWYIEEVVFRKGMKRLRSSYGINQTSEIFSRLLELALQRNVSAGENSGGCVTSFR